ncbi:potassium transporter Kup [Novosphingobium sp. CECT 9465]|uniref:potassium transporter Kup n=1 Tax=Novosphingobium sp. CECT 9465 TaxID=2829794 RepID=UPI001E5496C6|nr:potassium transporter Kup [Novosphingobium sp. CECT 9465]CAH0497284.1 Low affinity potassium transport system protein kup [Novosphingobium sp. CECT 9465]
MSDAVNDAAVSAAPSAGHGQSGGHGGGHGHTQGSLTKLAIGAIGVVFGDIGTSPLYALRDTFAGHHPLPLDLLHVYGIISLMFWSMMIIVTFKYVSVIMRADNKGEGGSLALLALINQHTDGKRWGRGIILLGVFATALFYGDSMITPAVSVMGAIEGVAVYRPSMQGLIVPIVVAILIGLFFIQSRGTEKVAAFFGPIMLIYFATISVLGLLSILQYPSVVAALSPHYAVGMFIADPFRGFLAMGAAVLAVTGAEALYADMGHFGRSPIRVSWLVFVLPALVLNYLGQASLLIRNPAALESPFYFLAPEWFQWPLLFIASAAAVIASQAVISGAFSVTQQAIQLGFIPRMTIKHTSTAAGQIYIPVINWALMIAVILLVLVFQRSSNLTAAYGIAVTGAMLIDNFLLAVVLFKLWQWKAPAAIAMLALFFAIDAAYLGANLTKIPDGGWVPLVMGVAIFTLLTTWSRGRALMRENMAEGTIPLEVFTKSAHSSAARVPGTAIFMASTAAGVPSALLHNIKHNKVLHERVVILTVSIEDVPYVDEGERYSVKDYSNGFYRLTLRFGFLEETDVPAALKGVSMCGEPFNMMKTSFFLSRQTLIPSDKPGMALWREKLFAWMLRNAASAMEFFRLPTNRVVELGSQLKI